VPNRSVIWPIVVIAAESRELIAAAKRAMSSHSQSSRRMITAATKTKGAAINLLSCFAGETFCLVRELMVCLQD